MIVKAFDTPVADVPGHQYLVAGLEPDEPIFVLRARDAGALVMLAQYETLMRTGELFDAARSENLARDRAAFVAWRRQHVTLVRDPD